MTKQPQVIECVGKGDLDGLKAALQAGANPNEPGEDGNTALHSFGLLYRKDHAHARSVILALPRMWQSKNPYPTGWPPGGATRCCARPIRRCS